ncbi:hypothetical protein V8E54_002770 [Elaphomyces granulatus]
MLENLAKLKFQILKLSKDILPLIFIKAFGIRKSKDLKLTRKNSKFHGIYAGTTRIGDVAVQVRNQDEELETALVIEVGFSQDYESIIKACRSWLEGTKTARMCVVVFFEEEPKYKCPLDINMDEALDLRPRDIYMAGPFGPALFKYDEDADETSAVFGVEKYFSIFSVHIEAVALDETEPDDQAEPANDEAETAEEEDEGEANLTWVGNISTAFLERWKLNPRSNKTVRCGGRTNCDVPLYEHDAGS